MHVCPTTPPSILAQFSPSTQLLQSFAVFAGAFVMRPFGGVLFGYIGDKHGRVHSMHSARSSAARAGASCSTAARAPSAR